MRERFITTIKDDIMVSLLGYSSDSKTCVMIESYSYNDYLSYVITIRNIIFDINGGKKVKISRYNFESYECAKDKYEQFKSIAFCNSNKVLSGRRMRKIKLNNDDMIRYFINCHNINTTNRMIESLEFISKKLDSDNKVVITIRLLENIYELYINVNNSDSITLGDVWIRCIDQKRKEYLVDKLYNDLFGKPDYNLLSMTQLSHIYMTSSDIENFRTKFNDFCSNSNIEKHDERRLIKAIIDIIKEHI
jgi:hypothetical protein|nr:MAG TPA: hypothetical protein [Caudoviricetes sp.]